MYKRQAEEFVSAHFDAQEGFDVTSDHGVFVVLETQLTDELIREGYVREFISKVQQTRKKNGYEVSDRITITYCADDTVAAALEEGEEQIQKETLAVSITRVDALDEEAVDLNGHDVSMQLEKQSR